MATTSEPRDGRMRRRRRPRRLSTPASPGDGRRSRFRLAPAPFGPATAVLNGQTAATLASPTLTGTTSIASGTVSGSIVGTGSAASVSQVNLNGVLNVQNYGAIGNGAALSHDEVGAQAAIDAVCANPNGTPTRVHWPTPAKYYVNDAPWLERWRDTASEV